MITISPDPAHPRGGYALVSLDASDVPDEKTEVSVFDKYSERYLGDAGWQSARVLFGPYEVQRDGERAHIVIGPEIVNQIEEYANVRFEVGTAAGDVSWPDAVVPAPGAARIGGIMPARANEVPPEPALSARIPPESAPSPALELQSESAGDPEESQTIETEETTRSGGARIAAILVLLVLIAVVAYWLVTSGEDEQATAPSPEPEPVAAASDDPCSASALRGIDGFAGQLEALRGCGGKASADAALGIVERAAASGDGQALALFGTIYDGAVTDEDVEDTIGLTFGDVPATAAEYYARAVSAGADVAAEPLAALCARMSGMTDTLSRAAVTDYCGQ